MSKKRVNGIVKVATIVTDLLALNLTLAGYWIHHQTSLTSIPIGSTPFRICLLLNLCMLGCSLNGRFSLHSRKSRVEQVALNVFSNVLSLSLITIAIFYLADTHYVVNLITLLEFITLLFVINVLGRLGLRGLLRWYRKHGGNSRSIIFIGSRDNIVGLHRQMQDPTAGYRIIGYFDQQPREDFQCPYLGTLDRAVPYMETHGVEELYCSLPHELIPTSEPILRYCGNHLIRFYHVPNLYTYAHHHMHLETIGNTPVLTPFNEPLQKIENRFIKRTFDIVFSLCFLCTLFPIIYAIVAIVIKITSPGPIFFKQKRHGLNGQEFWCYKFRSMKVNKDADKLQATKNDPRKTKFGDFMRKTSIDELPQFINVLKGEMSVVGPRPHMLKHTEQYSALIENYMVRHYIKPGITGWAQVTGFRGETKELKEMEGRIIADIWYVEHWNFFLDILIIYKTIKNAVCKDKQAY